MCKLHHAALAALLVTCLISFASDPPRNVKPKSEPTRLRQAITGPSDTMDQALAAGATAVVTLQPIPPKTVPASNYPPGSAIMGQTLILGSVPARVWIEAQITGWAPEDLKVAQVRVDGIDLDGDGGGYLGSRADCDGLPMTGAGDLFAAVEPCTGGSCQGNASVPCLSDSDCSAGGTSGPCNLARVCNGDMTTPCQFFSDCTNAGTSGPCIVAANIACRTALTGRTAICSSGEPSRCIQRPSWYPPGGFVCAYGFQDKCDPRFIGSGIDAVADFDLSTVNPRFGFAAKPGEIVPDFAPSVAATFVLDVPANAKGTYRLDLVEGETFLQNSNPPPGNQIPVAEVRVAVIRVECGSCCTNFTTTGDCADGLSQSECDALPTADARHFRSGTTCEQEDCCNCTSNMDCQDNDVCTVDACVNSCYCTHTPVAGWNPATECCHPMTGAQGMIPTSSPCRTGGCNMGGSSGVPTYFNRADGSSCVSIDPCYGDGTCENGACMGEQYAGKDCPKVRFISFNTGTDATMKAYRVRLVSLHHPNPPYTGAIAADFSAHEGEVRWIGPVRQYVESSADDTAVYTSLVQCQPHYQSWSGIDPLHVTGGEIVPSSVYEVQSIAVGLDINNDMNYSAPITIATARWTDVVIPNTPPSATNQPDSADIAEIADKFRSTSLPPSKPRAMITGPGMSGIPDMGIDVSFSDIAVCVDANKGKGYPYPWPASCP